MRSLPVSGAFDPERTSELSAAFETAWGILLSTGIAPGGLPRPARHWPRRSSLRAKIIVSKMRVILLSLPWRSIARVACGPLQRQMTKNPFEAIQQIRTSRPWLGLSIAY